MKKYCFLFFVLLGFLSFAQSGESVLEKEIAKIDRMAFTNPDSALLMTKKLEPKIENDRLKGQLLLAKGSAYSVMNLSSEALKAGFESLSLAEKSKDSLSMVNSLGFIGNQYYILKLNKKAINYLNRAETIIDMLRNPDMNNMIGNNYFVKALIYKDNLDTEFAIRYFDKAIDAYSNLKERSSLLNKNITKIQKGYSLIDLGKTDEARIIFEEVINEAEQYKIAEIYSYAQIGLAATYEAKKQFGKATGILLKTEKQVQNTSNIGMLTELYDALSNDYWNLQDAPKYFFYSQKLESSLLKNDKMESRSFSDLLKKNVDSKNSELKDNQNSFTFFIILIILSALIILFFIKKRIDVLKIANREVY